MVIAKALKHNRNRARYMFGHNSPEDRPRELFKPSVDAESLVLEKKLISSGFQLFLEWRHNYRTSWFILKTSPVWRRPATMHQSLT